MTKNANPNEYKYSGYGIDSRRRFQFDYGFCKNVIRFVAHMSSSVHAITDEWYVILILAENPRQGLYNAKLTTEKKYEINFTEHHKKFCLSLHYNGINSGLFVDDIEIYKFKAKIFK